MKNYNNPLKSVVVVGILTGSLLFSVSCKKFVQIPPPKNELITSTVFQDSVSATAAVLGMYVKMMSSGGIGDGTMSQYTGLSCDELTYPNRVDADRAQFFQNSLSGTNGLLETFLWQDPFEYLYQANACVEGLIQSTSLTTSAKDQLLGEAKFIRAFVYFYLVNLFGPMPLETSTNYKVNAALPRTSVDSVYTQIVSDLTDCMRLLNPNNQAYGNSRPNAYAAMALLARVYLYQNNWSEAEATSDAIIRSGQYQLESSLNAVFLPSSTEAIWQLVPVIPGRETPEGVLYIPSGPSSKPLTVVSNYLLSAFEPGDSRRMLWFDSNVVGGVVYRYPFKYKLRIDNNTSPKEYTTVLRLAEQYLIRAEAEANGAGGGLGAALSDLNVIRSRANLPNYSGATDQASMLKAIYHERHVELCVEWGHRWLDLKRTGTVDQVMGTGGICASKGGSWNSDWAFYPIPLDQINLNELLIQNSGY